MSRRRTKLGAPISLRIEPDIREALQAFADDEERSLSSYIARVLRQHVEAKRQEVGGPGVRPRATKGKR
jgi:hypothetical protein